MAARKQTTKPVEKTTPVADIQGVARKGLSYRVLVRPLITEKAAHLAQLHKYAFVVDRSMNKLEIKKAVKEVYGVTPIAVAVSNVKGVATRFGRTAGRTKDWKKAIVTLKSNESIALHEGV